MWKPFALTLALGLLLTLPENAPAAQNMTALAQLGDGGRVWQVAVEGNLAYLVSYNSLQVLDITDPTHPEPRGSLPLPVSVGVAVAGTTAYVAAEYSTIHVIDVSDPDTPVLINTLPLNVDAKRLLTSQNRLYVCASLAGLLIYDITDPANPVLLGSYSEPDTDVSDIELSSSSSYALLGGSYLVSGAAQMVIVDIGDPTQPTFVGRWQTQVGGSVVMAIGPRPYAAVGNTVYVLDISNPSLPTVISSTTTDRAVLDLSWRPGQLLAFVGQGVRTFSFLPGGQISALQTLDLPGEGHGGTILEPYAYQAAGSRGVHVLDLSDPQNIEVAAYHDEMTFARRITLNGNIAYASGERLFTIDISEPAHPTVVGQIDLEAFRTIVNGDLLYAASTGGFVIADISIPSTPVILNSIPGNVLDIRLSGDRLYALESMSGLRIYDVSDPDSPLPLGFLGMSGPLDLAIWGSHAYVTDSNQFLFVIDVSNPDQPVLERTIPGNYDEMETANGYLYAARASDGLRVFDLADPANPVITDDLDFYVVSRLDVVGNYVYLTDHFMGIRIVDASDPWNLVEVANHEMPVWGIYAMDIAASGEVVVAGLSSGIATYRVNGAVVGVPDERSPRQLMLTATPNPFRENTTIRLSGSTGTATTAAIFDVNGRRLRAWKLPSLNTGAAIDWNGVTSAGEDVPSGLYYVQVKTNVETITTTLVRIR